MNITVYKSVVMQLIFLSFQDIYATHLDSDNITGHEIFQYQHSGISLVQVEEKHVECVNILGPARDHNVEDDIDSMNRTVAAAPEIMKVRLDAGKMSFCAQVLGQVPNII